jgi:hypothetical protein
VKENDDVEGAHLFAAFSFSSTDSVRIHDVHIGVAKWSPKEKIGDGDLVCQIKWEMKGCRVSM